MCLRFIISSLLLIVDTLFKILQKHSMAIVFISTFYFYHSIFLFKNHQSLNINS